jgi:hypothetical protein
MNPRSEKLAVRAANRNEWDGGFHLYTQRPRISPPPRVLDMTGLP